MKADVIVVGHGLAGLAATAELAEAGKRVLLLDQEGFPTREELVARYEERSGRSVADMRWYMTLAVWKSIVFMEGNYKRAVSGATDDPYLKQFGDGVVELAQQAEALALGSSHL